MEVSFDHFTHPSKEVSKLEEALIFSGRVGLAFPRISVWGENSDKPASIAGDVDFNEKSVGDSLISLENEDLLKFGMIPEFVGRLPVVTTLEELDLNMLIRIMQEPKNALIKQHTALFKMDGVNLEIKNDALKEIAKLAIQQKTGARGLRSILENILLKTMFELPDMENVIKVTVDNASVKGSSEPIVTYGKKSSTSVA